MSQSFLDRQERIRVAQACDNCRDKKSKCDGIKPICGRCQQKSLDCHYGVPKRVKNQQIMTDLANKVAHYESMLQKNISIQQTLRDGGSGSDDQFHSPALHIDSMTSLDMSGYPSTVNAAPNSDSRSTTTSSPPDVSRIPSEMNTLSNPTFDIDQNDDTQFVANRIQPPPRALLEQALHAFFQGTTILFSFFDEEEIDTLLGSGYGVVVNSQPHVALIQLCALAAVGCQYFPHTFDTALRMRFLSVVKLHLDGCMDEAPLPAIRVVALLTIYFTFEKRITALLYADMGLRLAMLHSNEPVFQADASNSWQRTLRSLTFLDGWLCSTSGHLPSLQSREIQSSIVMMGSVDSSMTSVIQYEMIKITALSNLVLKDIHHVRYVSSGTLSHYIKRLQSWLLALPVYMRLDHLLDVNQDAEFLLPILQVHLLYMSTIILVYRRPLVDLAIVDHKLSASDLFNQAQSLLEPCLWTGRQVAKILNVCILRGQIVQRCWMTIDSTSSTCNVLLYFITSQLLHRSDTADIEQDLAAAKQCLDVLAFCGQVDEAAGYSLVEFSSIYDNLAQIHMQETPQPSTLEQLDDARNNRLRQILSHVAEHLILPFEGGLRRHGNQLPNEAFSSANTGIPSSFAAVGGESPSITAHREPNDSFFLNDLGKVSAKKEKDLRKGKEPDQGSTGSRVRNIVFGS